jgi:TonB-linked SusC/RagA family outer membrane protein
MKTKITAFLTVLLAFVVQMAVAQQMTVTGRVTDETGMELPGVSISVKGTILGTQTDSDGKYTVQVEAGQSLQFSYIGMKTVERVVSGSSVIDVSLEPDATALEEVVVVAYGNQKKEAIVGSVVSLGSEAISKQQVTNVAQALQGTMPGVMIANSGGQPGSNPVIRIRGISSVNASASPLIVVDGVPYNGNLSDISQDQVESMNVLKDASSTALYGSRGSNGVILITTKGGKLNTAPSITFTSVTGISSPAVPLHNTVGTDDLVRYNWEALKNTYTLLDDSQDNVPASEAGYVAADRLMTNFYGYNPYNVPNPIFENGVMNPSRNLLWETDWEDVLLRKSTIRTEHTLSAHGGSDKTRYFISGSYLNQEGNVKTAEYERIGTRLNLTTNITDWLEVGMNNSIALAESVSPTQDGSSMRGSTQWIYRVGSLYPVYRWDANGNLMRDAEGNLMYDYGNASGLNGVRPGQAMAGENAAAAFGNYRVSTKRTNFTTQGFVNLNLTKDLTFRTHLAYENFMTNGHTYASPEFGYAAVETIKGRVIQSRNIFTTLNFVNKLTYDKQFGVHGVTADAIFETYSGKNDSFSATKTGYLPGIDVIGGGATMESIGGGTAEERLVSYLARVAYNYNYKYFVEASFRRDGSTRFAEDLRWGSFFSVGGSWIVSEESFLKGVGPINFLKLKASYGELGNNRISNSDGSQNFFPYLQVFTTGQDDGLDGTSLRSGVLLGGVTDTQLTWEKTASLNIGAEFGLFDDRITGLVEYYNKESIDLIMNEPIAPSTGDRSKTTNLGSIRNYGLEVTLNGTVMKKGKFKWVSGFNFSVDRNKFTELPQDEILTGNKKYTVGSSVYDFYIQDWAGVDPTDGQGMWYKDVIDSEGNRTGQRTTTKDYAQASRYYAGSSLPDIIGGFNTDLTWGNFDFNMLFSFSFGSQLYDSDYASLMSTTSLGLGLHPDIGKRWQQPGDVTDVPLLVERLPVVNSQGVTNVQSNGYSNQSTRFLFDNDWARLRAVTLGYTLPQNLTQRFYVKSFRVFLRGDNLFTFSALKGGDPEQGIDGGTGLRSSILRTGSIGVNIQF